MSKGGYRPGAGRPKGSKSPVTLKVEQAKAELIRMYMEKIRPINKALIKKAMEGDIQAIRELHDRVYGRAMQAVELSGKDGAPIQISGMKIVKESGAQDSGAA